MIVLNKFDIAFLLLLLLELNTKRAFLKTQKCEKLGATTHYVFKRNGLPYLGFSLETKRNKHSATEE